MAVNLLARLVESFKRAHKSIFHGLIPLGLDMLTSQTTILPGAYLHSLAELLW